MLSRRAEEREPSDHGNLVNITSEEELINLVHLKPLLVEPALINHCL